MELLLISCGSPDASGPPHTTEGLTEMWVFFFGDNREGGKDLFEMSSSEMSSREMTSPEGFLIFFSDFFILYNLFFTRHMYSINPYKKDFSM